MWTCPKCGRIFNRANHPHSCNKIPLASHFTGKEKAKELFDCLVAQINKHVGKYKIFSIPCCIHLFGTYDFLAALPKKDRLEIRIALGRIVDSPRLKVSVPLSKSTYKNCFDIYDKKEIDREFISWLKESYHLKD